MNEPKWRVGDVVYLHSWRNLREARVTRVGRKFFYVDRSRRPFLLGTGRDPEYVHNYVVSVADEETARERAAKENLLRQHGISAPEEWLDVVHAAVVAALAKGGE